MIRRFFAGMLVFLFVLLAFPLVSSLVVFKSLLDRDFYKGEFLNIAYESGVAFVSDEIVSGGTSDFSSEELAKMLRSVFVKEDLETFIDNLFDQIETVDFLRGGKVYAISLPLDFIRAKKSFVAEAVADKLISNLDACESPSDFSFEDLNCLPEGMLVSEIKSVLVLNMEDEIFKTLPSSLSFDLQVPKGIYSLLVIVSLALVLLLILLALVIHRPWVRVLKWEMKALFSASFLLIMSFLPLYFLVDGLVEKFGVSFSVLVYVIQVISLKVVFYIGPLFVISFILWIVALIYDRKLDRSVNTTTI